MRNRYIIIIPNIIKLALFLYVPPHTYRKATFYTRVQIGQNEPLEKFIFMCLNVSCIAMIIMAYYG
jgi:hypothetical protein